MANRKQRRKTKTQNESNDYIQDNKTILITLVIVLVVFAIFYLITVLVNDSKRKLNTQEPPKSEAAIQYYEILGDDTFTMSPDEYYVLFYDFDGPNAVYYDYIFNGYAGVEGQYIFKVDLGNGFNKKFVSKETNKYANEAGELKVKDATLLKIRDGRNVLYVEGEMTQISAELK